MNEKGEETARKFISEFSVNEANNMTTRWKELGHYLLVKYMDGNVKREKDGKFETNESGKLPVQPLHPSYPDSWYRSIIKDNEAHFKANE